MFERPKPGEDEDDILRMQEEFLRKKEKNANLRPAAQVTNLRPVSQTTKRSSTDESDTRKPSKYAQSKGLKSCSVKRARNEESTSIIGDILEKNLEESPTIRDQEDEDDKVYFPKVIPSILGEIIEKNVDDFVEIKPMPSKGFPVATKRDLTIVPGEKSIYAQHIQKMKQLHKPVEMDIDVSTSSNISLLRETCQRTTNLPLKSYILSSEEADTIHNENIGILKKMSEKEILEEQKKLMLNLDPKLIEFVKNKRSQGTNKEKQSVATKDTKSIEKMDTSGITDDLQLFENDTLWENDILSHPNVDKWLHFDSLEKDKLEWMKGVDESKKIKADEPYEARFNFKGYLLPYTLEYTEKTKTLFHHGEEPHRPGYSLSELFELSRSTVTQQRVMALNILAGILEYYNAGTYKNVIEIPLSKIFFIIRYAIDENKEIILEPALKAMRNLLYNRIDEASLDALLGFEEGNKQPCLENDKSEIEELESKESELKDFHLAEIDIIAALLRTDILQRIYYILETVRPSFNCVQYALQILTRLARDSIVTADRIMQMDHLMDSIVKNFIPPVSINFMFTPQLVYNGKPILAALKFIRVLCLYPEEISHILITKYNILKSISEYISSGVDGTYGLRIQIEAFCILSNLIHCNLGIQSVSSLFPIIATTLFKHVQGTDIFINSSVLSATHAAVVLQLINNLLNCNITNLDDYKHQIYPLLKDGTQKWLTQLSNSENFTCAHLRLLSSALDCCKTILLIEKVTIKAFNDSLMILLSSRGFKEVIKQLIPSSNLLSSIETKDLHLTKNLVSLGSSVIDSVQKVLPVLNAVSPVPFLTSLYKLLEIVNIKEISVGYVDQVSTYIMKLATKMPSLCDNWFTRMETDFVFSVVKISVDNETVESKKDILYMVANKLCYILRIDKRYELHYLFNNVIFNKQWFTTERLINLMSLSDADDFCKPLTALEDIKLCYSKVINLNYADTGPNILYRIWKEPILPRDWIYLPILNLYSKSQELDTTPKVGDHVKKVQEQIAKEKEFIVSCSLEWILFNESCFHDLLNDIDITDRFCRILCVFLCDNSLFLEPKIRTLLRKCVQVLFKKEKKKGFNFDEELLGLNNFQDFYTQLLEQFQSVSYGDETFAACILAPIAQKHNVKWRKLLWSEYAGCLRALDCPETMLCYSLNEYLYPVETDETLIKSYFQALSSNLLRPDTIPSRIATNHVEKFKKLSNLVTN